MFSRNSSFRPSHALSLTSGMYDEEDPMNSHVSMFSVRFNLSFPHVIHRARAAWLLSKLSTLKFTREDILQETLRALVNSILSKDEELPVKVEAAFAIEVFIQNQHRTHEYIQPQVSQHLLYLFICRRRPLIS